MIGVVNYGAGNLSSVINAFVQIGHEAQVINNPQEINDLSHLVLPGVGSFSAAMQALNSLGWSEAIREFSLLNRPILGICLGMQVFFEQGEEEGITPGLELIPGKVTKFKSSDSLRVPHVGWNNLITIAEHPIFDGVKPAVDFYFVHSYHCIPSSPENILATCDYGGEFVAGVVHNNIIGLQFHPEKSQPGGLRILDNFAQWDGSC